MNVTGFAVAIALALALALLLGAGTACLPELRVPANAALSCASASDCPDDFTCLDAHGRCVPRDGACLEGDGDAVTAIADGSECPLEQDTAPGICVAGVCASSRCGDGFVDGRLGEECDQGADNRDRSDALCLTTCVLPFCGDGIVATTENCEGPADNATCESTCILRCNLGFGDCDALSRNGCECSPKLEINDTIDPEEGLPIPEPETGTFVSYFRARLIADGNDLWSSVSGFLFALPAGADAVTIVVDPTDSIPDETLFITRDIALDDRFVFWTLNDRVIRANKTGEPDALFWVVSDGTVHAIALDEEFLYFTSGFFIARTQKDTAAEQEFHTLARMEGFTSSIAVSDAALFYADFDGGKVARADKLGVPVGELPDDALILAESEPDPRGIAVHEDFVYWGTGDGAIKRVPADGGEIEVLAQVDLSADHLVIARDSIFWTAVGALDGRAVVYRMRFGGVPTTMMSLEPELGDMTVGDDRVWASRNDQVFSVPLGAE